MKISRAVSTFVFMLLAACTLTQGMDLAPTPLATARPLPAGTLIATRQRELHDVSTPTANPSETNQLYICDEQTAPSIPTYVINAELNYAQHTIKVAQKISYYNLTSTSLNELVINVKPNSHPGVFKLMNLSLGDSQSPKSNLTGQKLTIALPQAMLPGCKLELKLQFEIHIPPIDTTGINAYQGYLGYSYRQTNLGLWLPVVAAHDNAAWIIHDDFPIGEQDLFEVANWDVNLTLKNAPKSVQIAAPGTIMHLNDTEWSFTMSNARDFSLSLGEDYHLIQQQSSSGINVELYTFADTLLNASQGNVDSAGFALSIAARSVNLYESLYGAFPLKRLVIVEGDFPDGMEFSGIVYVGGEYFREWRGIQSYLTIITAHEIAHQWWYARVGSDQALYPWLDEALATFSEFVFIERYYPEYMKWWWNFRVNRLNPQGYVDSSVYEFTSRRTYINAVYLRGVLMLNDLRIELGDDVFFGWLNRYAATYAGEIATSADFWSLLTSEQLLRTESIRERYLRHPT